ncbi:MAG: phosphoglycerate dehydrogenase [Candidatus Poribacteria bacterium]|nr:phosphoglycerate dehydrogenase [Candidatus Poribacteria bacterium]
MMRVLVSDSLSQSGLDLLAKEADLKVDVETNLASDELIDRIGVYDALIIRSATKVTAEVIDAAKQLKVIGRAGVGVDNIELDAATRHGILVVNTPTGNTIAAAEHTMTTMLALSRNILPAGISVRNGEWTRSKFMGVELYGKTLGIIGLGRIGAQVAHRAQAFEMEIIAYDPYISAEAAEKLGVHLVKREDLFKRADYISLHTLLSPETYYSISDAELALMKPECRLINCARGGLIDEAALYCALKEGRIAGAALDVFEKEPATGNPLLTLDNVLATPHLGASTAEAQIHVAVEVVHQVINALRGLPVTNAVNQPKIDWQTLEVFGPYLTLAERIGSFQAQIVDGQISEIQIDYRGDLFDEDVTPITVALQKGLLTPVLQTNVNYVNAPFLIQQRGIRITETKTRSDGNFANSIAITVITDGGKREIEGTTFGQQDARIVRIDQHHVNVKPEGYMILISNQDQPGMIGLIGTILGHNHINIADMAVGRSRIGEHAVMVINVDSLVPRDVIQHIANQDQIFFVKQVKL